MLCFTSSTALKPSYFSCIEGKRKEQYILPVYRTGLIYDPMVQPCLFDDSWSTAGRRRRRLGSVAAPDECAADVTSELEQLEARLQSAHSEEMEQLKAELKASHAQEMNDLADGLAESAAERAAQQQLELKAMLTELLSTRKP